MPEKEAHKSVWLKEDLGGPNLSSLDMILTNIGRITRLNEAYVDGE